MSWAPYSCGDATRPKCSGRSRRSSGPLSVLTPQRSSITPTSPSQRPGITIRSQSPISVRCRAIHEVVIRAATVMRRTTTSYRKSGAMRSSVARSAGSASLPVTNRVLGTGPRDAELGEGSRSGGLVGAARLDPLVGRAFHVGARGRPPEDRLVEPVGQREVTLGDAVAGVGAQLHPHLAPRHLEIRVMP